MTKPLTPAEVSGKKAASLPPEVIEAFNELIVKHYDGRGATIQQKEVAKMIASKLSIRLSEVFNNGYLDVEEVFREAGWKVDYDKPGYNETYEATFSFSGKR